MRLVNTHDAVDDILRATLLEVVVDLLTVRVNPAGDDMDVVVVGIVVAIYQERLSRLGVTHITEVLMGYLDQFFLGVFVAPTGYSQMKLRVFDAPVLGGIIQEKRGEVFPRVGIAYGNIAEVGHFQQFGAALGDLALIVFHGMEVGTGWKYRCYHKHKNCIL